MDFVKIALFGVLAVACVCFVRKQQQEIAVVVGVVAGVVLVGAVCDGLFDVVYAFYNLSESAGVDSQSFGCVVKVVGIGYLAEFGNGIACDAGCKSLGDKILLAAKVAIVGCALPIVTSLFDLLKGFVA